MTSPNVLLLLTDQQSYDTIAAAGAAHMRTPHLDRLAAEGALVTGAFCNSPICMPSRQSLFSGQYPAALGLTFNGQEMPLTVPVLPRMLQPHGYRTANIGKLHFRNVKGRDDTTHPDYGFDRLLLSDTIAPGYRDVYDDWVERRYPGQAEKCRSLGEAAWTCLPGQYRSFNPYIFQGPDGATHSCFVADQTCEFIRESRGQPWFAAAGFFAPHDPINPPAKFLEWYDPARLPAPVMTAQDRERTGLTDDDWRIVRRHFYALISHIDEQVGVLLDCLDATAQADDTLVIFTSDHGDNMGHHGCGGKGAPGLDSCAHVPLLWRLPGRIPAGRRCEGLTELVDVAPTILEFCGVERHPLLQGRSLVPWLTGQTDAGGRESVFMEIGPPNGEQWKAVRTDRLFFALNNAGDEELYDLAADPHQLHNLAADGSAAVWRRSARPLPERETQVEPTCATDAVPAETLRLEGYRLLTQRIFQARANVPDYEVTW